MIKKFNENWNYHYENDTLPKVVINGLDEYSVKALLSFMKSKLDDDKYKSQIIVLT